MSPPTPDLDEAQTLELTDEKPITASWAIQDKSSLNLYESIGVTVREMDTNKIQIYDEQMKGRWTSTISYNRPPRLLIST
jgi:hypothetical protein